MNRCMMKAKQSTISRSYIRWCTSYLLRTWTHGQLSVLVLDNTELPWTLCGEHIPKYKTEFVWSHPRLRKTCLTRFKIDIKYGPVFGYLPLYIQIQVISCHTHIRKTRYTAQIISVINTDKICNLSHYCVYITLSATQWLLYNFCCIFTPIHSVLEDIQLISVKFFWRSNPIRFQHWPFVFVYGPLDGLLAAETLYCLTTVK